MQSDPRIALWAEPWARPAMDLWEIGFRVAAGGVRPEIERVPMDSAAELVRQGLFDAALVPSIDVLSDAEPYDVYAATAFSSWRNPFLQLCLPHGLDPLPKLVDAGGSDRQTRFVTRVVLREQYGSRAEIGALDGRSGVGRIVSEARPTSDGRSSEVALDLGQEWMELANYPMVWGVFATTRGTATDPMKRLVRDAAGAAEKARTSWLSENPDAPEAEFVRQDLRFRLDDVATASLTELAQYLFYLGITDEMVPLPLVYLPDGEPASEPDVLL